MSRATINRYAPQALATCDRCGFRYNLVDLRWQFDWRGTRLQDLRTLVCQRCYDKPQQSGQRAIILPPDPVPVSNPRPEYYVADNNPLSPLNANPNPLYWEYSNQFGSMVNGGGVPAAFNGNPSKTAQFCATIDTPRSSYQNYVGINWGGNQNVPTLQQSPVYTHTLSSYTIRGPVDAAIGSTAYVVQGAYVPVGWGAWTTLASGDIAGTNSEVLSGEPTAGGRYPYHRVAFLGGAGAIAVGLVTFSVSDRSSET